MATRMLSFFKAPAAEEPPGSVLAAWQSYASGEEPDPERGAVSTPPPYELTGKIGDVARRIGSSVKDTASGAASSAANLGSRHVVRAVLRGAPPRAAAGR
jgi:hypothetical protein